MTLEAGLIGYCALTLLGLSMPKHRRPLGLAHLPSERMARWSGWLVLGVSAIIAWHGLGFALGSTVWLGQICLSALALTLLMSWKPQRSFQLAGVTVATGIITLIYHNN